MTVPPPDDPTWLDGRNKLPNFAPFRKPVVAPTTEPDEPPYICLKVNLEWQKYMVAALDVLAWPDAWDDTPANQTVHAMRGAQLVAMVMSGLLCGAEMMLRQNPDDPCQLEQSFDGGLTWSLAFDFGLCPLFKPKASTADREIVINLYNQVIVSLGELNELYDGTPHSIAPGMNYDGSGLDVQRDKALCGAIYMMVRIFAEVGLKKAEEAEEEFDDLLDGIADVIRDVGTAILIAVGLGWAAAAWQEIAIALFVATLAPEIIQFLTGVDKSIFRDPAAQAEIACCIFNNLRSEDITETAFNNALDPACEWENEHSAELATWMTAALQQRDVYLEFLRALEDAHDLVTTGAELPCDCPDWTSTFEFADDNGEFSLHPDFAGEWIIGIGWVAYEEEASDPRLRIYRQFPDTFQVKSVRAEFSLQCGSSSTVERPQIVHVYGPLVDERTFIFKDCPGGSGPVSVTHVASVEIDRIEVQAGMGALGTGAVANIKRIIINGAGVKPAFLP